MSRYATLVGTNKIKDDWSKINSGFDAVQSDMDLSTALRQAVINGGFVINQRVKTGTVTLAAGAYGHDRWKAGAAGCTYSFATVNNVTTFTIQAGSLMQVIEGANIYSGNYTLSWQGSAQGRINSGAYGSSGISALLTGGNNTTIEFGSGTLSNVQFNYGSTAFPFQSRIMAAELLLCKRYCQVITDPSASNTYVGMGSAYSTTGAAIAVIFPVQMRVRPTLIATVGDWQIQDGWNTPISLSGISIFSGSNSTVSTELNATVSGGLTQFRTYYLTSTTANKLMIFDAEI